MLSPLTSHHNDIIAKSYKLLERSECHQATANLFSIYDNCNGEQVVSTLLHDVFLHRLHGLQTSCGYWVGQQAFLTLTLIIKIADRAEESHPGQGPRRCSPSTKGKLKTIARPRSKERDSESRNEKFSVPGDNQFIQNLNGGRQTLGLSMVRWLIN